MRASPVARFLATLRKGGEGSGFAHHLGRPGFRGGSAAAAHNDGAAVPPAKDLLPPSSAHITTADQAREYWREYFEGRTFTPTVETKRGPVGVSVAFPVDWTHMWTRKAFSRDPIDAYDNPSSERGRRTFHLARARLMDRILPTITNPTTIRADGKKDELYLGSEMPDGQTFVVVLHMVNRTRLRFVAAYPRSPAEIAEPEKLPEKLPGEKVLKKAVAPPFWGRATGVTPPRDGAPVSPGADGFPLPFRLRESGPPNTALEDLGRFFALFKAKALGAGERWITVHPNGPGEKGTPILIKIQPDGSAKVLGGAGGKLNHLRLHGVKSEEDYRAEAQGKDKAYRDKKKEQAASDKREGLTQNKSDARAVVRDQLQQHQATFVKTVSDAWAGLTRICASRRSCTRTRRRRTRRRRKRRTSRRSTSRRATRRRSSAGACCRMARRAPRPGWARCRSSPRLRQSRHLHGTRLQYLPAS